MYQIQHKIGECIPCGEAVARFHRPGGGPWFCADCGTIEGESI